MIVLARYGHAGAPALDLDLADLRLEALARIEATPRLRLLRLRLAW